jgi:spore germination protein YaaH
MAKLNNLQGTYNRVGNFLIHTAQNLKLLITERTKVTDKKSVKFLLNKTDNKGNYISSLYQASDNTGVEVYNFDYQGVKYTLKQSGSDGMAEISIQSA